MSVLADVGWVQDDGVGEFGVCAQEVLFLGWYGGVERLRSDGSGRGEGIPFRECSCISQACPDDGRGSRDVGGSRDFEDGFGAMAVDCCENSRQSAECGDLGVGKGGHYGLDAKRWNGVAE